MSEEVNINMFNAEVGPLLEPAAAYTAVTMSTEMTAKQVQWQDVTQTCLSDSGGTTPSLQPANQPVQLQIVGLHDEESLAGYNQTYPVLPPSQDALMTTGAGYTPHPDLLRLSQGASDPAHDPSQDLRHDPSHPDLPADLPSVSSSADTDTFLTDVISMPPHPFKVFRHVTAVLSEDLLTAIPGCQSVVLENLQSDFGVQLLSGQTERGEQEIHITGDLKALSKVQRHLEDMCGVDSNSKADCDKPELEGSEHENISGSRSEIKTLPRTEDKSVYCDILVPAISQRGRVIKPHSKYINYLRMMSLLDEGDFELEDPVERRKRKAAVSRMATSLEGSAVKKSRESRISSRHLKTLKGSASVDFSSGDNVSASPPCDMDAGGGDNTSDLINVAEPVHIPDTPGREAATHEASGTGESIEDKKVKRKKDYEKLAPYKFFCKKCSFKTKRQSHFLNHKRLHDKQVELLRCEKCNFTSLRLSHLRRHEASHSAETFSCSKCHYHTDQVKLLQRHYKKKHESTEDKTKSLEVLSCPSCKYTTTRRFHFERHLRTHPDETDLESLAAPKTFECELCQYVTHRKECLYRHRSNVHSEKRPYLCDLCGKSFKRPDALAQHKVTHVDKGMRVYPYKCQRCPKSFRSRGHLNDHMDSHSNQRAHLCHICGTSFKTRSVQRKHIQSIHNNPKSFQCNGCERKFNTKFSLNRHTRTCMQDVTDIAAGTVSPICDTQDVLVSEVTAAAKQIQVQQVHDVIVPSVGEVYNQTGETGQHILNIQTTDGRPTFLYLSGFQTFQDST